MLVGERKHWNQYCILLILFMFCFLTKSSCQLLVAENETMPITQLNASISNLNFSLHSQASSSSTTLTAAARIYQSNTNLLTTVVMVSPGQVTVESIQSPATNSTGKWKGFSKFE
jgi:hypothetical protein